MTFNSLLITAGLLSVLPPFIANASPPQSQPENLSNYQIFRDFADILRLDGLTVPGFLDDPQLSAVTREFGPAIISTRQLPYRSEVAIADTVPWSSWWFPKKETFLFQGDGDPNQAPLTKYDLFRAEIYRQAGKPVPKSAAKEEDRAFNPNSLTWEGLCDAWSIAAISHPEPKHAVNVNIGESKLTFSVADLKALLLKTYEGVDDKDLKYYGQKFTGDVNGWIFPDIFPEQFHRFLIIQLFQKKQAFFMDHDPGIEIWSVPVYKANYTISAVPEDPNAVFVQAWLYSAEAVHSDEKDFVGTREAVREYNYILKGSRNTNGDLVVESGFWTKGPDGIDSRQEHPDYFVKVRDRKSLVRRSWNPEIEVELVDKILEGSR